jgi:hypothetical protein
MATAAQLRANRLNARKSTGPRTPEGKAVVAQNAVQHGLLARAALLQGEDWEEFTEFRENLVEELAPEGTLEGMLAERIVSLSWRLQRAARLQNEAYESLYLLEATSGYARRKREEMAQGRPDGPQTNADDLIGGRVLVEDFGGDKVLERILLYERRIENSLYRTMGELQRLRRMRKSEPSRAGATAEAGLPRSSTGILPVSSMGVPPMNVQGNRGRDTRGIHDRDGRATGTPNAIKRVWEPTHGRDAHATETPCGVTTNAVAVSMNVPASLANNSESAGGREPVVGATLPGRPVEAEGDCAKQSQLGADQIGANLGRNEGLHQEEYTAPAEEQSQNEGDLTLSILPFGSGQPCEAACHLPV